MKYGTNPSVYTIQFTWGQLKNNDDDTREYEREYILIIKLIGNLQSYIDCVCIYTLTYRFVTDNLVEREKWVVNKEKNPSYRQEIR